MTTINFTPATSTPATAPLYNIVANNMQTIGKKKFACIPLELLATDSRYQRDAFTKESKINFLVDNWNADLMDPIRVSPHPEEALFYIVNGFHRVEAMRRMGCSDIEAEVLIDMPSDPEQRLVAEAKLFGNQLKAVDKLTPIQSHNANVLTGVAANILLERIAEKYNVNIKPANCQAREKRVNTVTAFATALRVANKGEQLLDDIFDIICYAGWNMGTEGFTHWVIQSLNNILSMHPDMREASKTALKEYFRTREVENVLAEAIVKYPLRKKGVQMTLFLEDYLHTTIGMPYVYTKEEDMITTTQATAEAVA